MIPRMRVPVGGISGEPVFDVIVSERGGYSVYSEGSPRRRLGGPYASRALAEKRLRVIEFFKHHKNHRDARPSRRVLPRQIPPTRICEDYGRALVRAMRGVRAAYAPVVRAMPDIIEQARAERGDAAGSDKLRALLEQARREAAKAISQPQLEQLGRKFADQTAKYHKEQLRRQVHAVLGADPVFRDRGMTARADQWVHENVSLIERIPADLHGRVASRVTRAVASGQRASNRGGEDGTLTRDIENEFGVAERHARVIARDQVGKFYARVNHARQREIGVTRFVWRTVGDERVRGAPGGKYANATPSHYELDGEEFDYDDPPDAGPDGEPCLPGEAICCRCWSEPVLDQDDDEEEDDDEESDDDT